jgi:hypothetical protein
MAQNFNFDAYNQLTNSAGSGLKLHLALQLLRDVDYTMYKFDNPLQQELSGAISALKLVQVAAKQQAKDRVAAKAE